MNLQLRIDRQNGQATVLAALPPDETPRATLRAIGAPPRRTAEELRR